MLKEERHRRSSGNTGSIDLSDHAPLSSIVQTGENPNDKKNVYERKAKQSRLIELKTQHKEWKNPALITKSKYTILTGNGKTMIFTKQKFYESVKLLARKPQ